MQGILHPEGRMQNIWDKMQKILIDDVEIQNIWTCDGRMQKILIDNVKMQNSLHCAPLHRQLPPQHHSASSFSPAPTSLASTAKAVPAQLNPKGFVFETSHPKSLAFRDIEYKIFCVMRSRVDSGQPACSFSLYSYRPRIDSMSLTSLTMS